MTTKENILVLGIETSCDETAAAVVDGKGNILSNAIYSQLDAHEVHGGVVPEIAAREHLKKIDVIIQTAMKEAGADYKDLSAVASTTGPGLIGGVMIGMMAGKSIATANDVPFMSINHLEGHALSPRLGLPDDQELSFPYLLLLVSGGHSALVDVQGVGEYETLGTTLDDALGELFDKSGKVMGLPYPGGPEVEKMAAKCADINAACERFDLPRPMKGRKELHFSFSGLKTAVKNHVDQLPVGDLEPSDVVDLCASLQEAVADVLHERCTRALKHMNEKYNTPVALVVAGGVAANKRLRKELMDVAENLSTTFFAPRMDLCSDNGAMIAWAAAERLNHGEQKPETELSAAARPRWPLDDLKTPREAY